MAQCAPTLARTLPLRRRSSPKTSPPTVVRGSVPSTITTGLPPTAATPALLAPMCDAGRTCQHPKSTDIVVSTCHGRQYRASVPHSTDRKASSSESTVPSGMTTRAVRSAAGSGRS